MGFNVLAGTGSVVGAVIQHGPAVAAATAGAVVIQSGALWWRRKQPLAVLLVVVAVDVASVFISPNREPSGIALAFAVYAVSVYDQTRWRLIVAAASIAVVLAAVAAVILGFIPALRALIPAGALALIAWVVGDYIRSRRTFFAELVERHKQEREQAAEQERLRIARELHDVVAHNVSVMAIQAGAARVSGSSKTDALASIEKEARDTLAKLNKLLGVLRKSPEAPDLAPQPTLDEVDALLKPARDAGLRAILRVTGEPRRLSSAIDLSAYRIVQEAITNVLKHAGASRVEVVIDYQTEALALTVSDNGTGPQSSTSNGHGLVGMRERVELFGGHLSTGSSALGGFTVRATLPVKDLIRVAIADDQAMVRAGFRMIVDSQPDMQVAGEAADGNEAIELVEKMRPDVVLMDVRMPRLDGIAATKRVATMTRVVILTTFELDEYVFDALAAGASAFLLKAAPPEDLVRAIRVVAQGDALLAPSVTRRLIEEFARRPEPTAKKPKALDVLTDRELEVLKELARGLTNQEIANHLHVSETTIKTHVAHLFGKLEVRDRVQAVILAYEAGLVG